MTQNKFLGTIGYIKANLMSSSQASEKGYRNENFYPGAENIPDSEASVSFPFKKIGNIVVDENFVATGFSDNNYIQLGNMPDFPKYFECCIAFSSTKLYNSNNYYTWYTRLIAPSKTNPTYTKGFNMYIKGKYSNTGAEATISNTSSFWGVHEAGDNYTRLKVSANKKYKLVARREPSTSAGSTVQMVLSLYNADGGLIASLTRTGSGTPATQLVNLTNHVLGVGDGSRTFFDGGSIYLKECYFKALDIE